MAWEVPPDRSFPLVRAEELAQQHLGVFDRLAAQQEQITVLPPKAAALLPRRAERVVDQLRPLWRVAQPCLLAPQPFREAILFADSVDELPVEGFLVPRRAGEEVDVHVPHPALVMGVLSRPVQVEGRDRRVAVDVTARVFAEPHRKDVLVGPVKRWTPLAVQALPRGRLVREAEGVR